MKSKTINFKDSDFEPIRIIALAFPGTAESISYENTPSIKVRGKLMCRLHGNREFIAIRLAFDIRDKFLDTYPEIFYLADRYKAYPYICMWTQNKDKKLLTEILEVGWKGLATKKQLTD